MSTWLTRGMQEPGEDHWPGGEFDKLFRQQREEREEVMRRFKTVKDVFEYLLEQDDSERWNDPYLCLRITQMWEHELIDDALWRRVREWIYKWMNPDDGQYGVGTLTEYHAIQEDPEYDRFNDPCPFLAHSEEWKPIRKNYLRRWILSLEE